jgi:hypothetical protein
MVKNNQLIIDFNLFNKDKGVCAFFKILGMACLGIVVALPIFQDLDLLLNLLKVTPKLTTNEKW